MRRPSRLTIPPATIRPAPSAKPPVKPPPSIACSALLTEEEHEEAADDEEHAQTLPRAALRLGRRAEPVPAHDLAIHLRLDRLERAGEGVLQLRERDDVAAAAEDPVEELALVGQQPVVVGIGWRVSVQSVRLNIPLPASSPMVR